MHFIINKKQYATIFLLAIILAIILYNKTLFLFYQQDEWQGVGHMFALGNGYLTNGLFTIGTNRPLTNILNYFLFTTIPFNVSLVSTLYILLHAVNSFLVFILTFNFFRRYIPSLLAMVFFEVNSVAYQAVAWVGNGTPVAAFIVLCSLIAFIYYYRSNNKKYGLFSYALLILSFFFKEIGIAFLPVYLTIDILKNKRDFLSNKILLLPIFYSLLFVGVRLFTLLNRTQRAADFVNTTMPLQTILTFHSIVYVLIVFSQIFIPPQIGFSLADTFMKAVYPSFTQIPQYPALTQTIGTDIIMIIISALILLVVFLFAVADTRNTFPLIFSVILIATATLPYIIIIRGDSYLESRYYYLQVAGMSIIIGYIAQRILSNRNMILNLLCVALMSLYVLFHANVILTTLYDEAQISNERSLILKKLKSVIPKADKKIIFYINSNESYIVPNNPLPFQQGIGYTLLVWYFNKNNQNWRDLLLDNFLWNIGSEGYKQVGDQGFGYFYNFDELKKTVQKYKLQPQDVVSFYWDGNTNTLTDTTRQIRQKLK